MAKSMKKPAPVTEASNCPGYLEPEAARQLRNALARAEGHVGSIKQMVDDRRCADEILTQIAAVRGALARVATNLLEKELLSCLGAWDKKDPAEAERRFNEAMRAVTTMLKQS